MPLAIPPELKKISPFVRRAEELDKDTTAPQSRLVAYYCRQYAVFTGIPLSNSSPAAKTCLGHLLGSLEQEKPAMDNFTRDEAALLCRQFATGVFDRADAEDRAGNATKDTAKTFYAAASFLQILEQFYPDNDTSEEVTEDKRRIIYAKWKATEILKAFKEGRQPTPGGYGEGADAEELQLMGSDVGDNREMEKKMDAPTKVITVRDDDDDDDDGDVKSANDDLMPPLAPATGMRPPMRSSLNDSVKKEEVKDEEGTEIELGPPPAYPLTDVSRVSFSLPPPVEPKPLPPPPAETKPLPPPPSQPASNPTSSAKPPSPKSQKSSLFGFGRKPTGKPSKAQITDATELTRFALAALEDKDSDLAAERLQQALQALGR